MAFEDDSSIGDDETLLRRVPPTWWVFDENLRRTRPTSAAFEDDELSVHLLSVLTAAALPPTHTLAGHTGYYLTSISAGQARGHNLPVCRDPLPDDGAHAIVAGKKSRGVARALAVAALWVVAPPQ